MAKTKSIVNDDEAGKANVAANLAAEGERVAAEPTKRGPGRPKGNGGNLTVASFKALVRDHSAGLIDLPDNIRFTPPAQVGTSTRWTPPVYTTGAHWRVSGPIASVVTLTSNGRDVTETVGKSVNVADYL